MDFTLVQTSINCLFGGRSANTSETALIELKQIPLASQYIGLFNKT